MKKMGNKEKKAKISNDKVKPIIQKEKAVHKRDKAKGSDSDGPKKEVKLCTVIKDVVNSKSIIQSNADDLSSGSSTSSSDGSGDDDDDDEEEHRAKAGPFDEQTVNSNAKAHSPKEPQVSSKSPNVEPEVNKLAMEIQKIEADINGAKPDLPEPRLPPDVPTDLLAKINQLKEFGRSKTANTLFDPKTLDILYQ